MREDLIASAVTFLRDPNVASAPQDKKVAFLKAKNMTDEEINTAMARAADPNGASSALVPAPPVPSYPPGGYAPQAYYGHPGQTPDVPGRDWRDYFIMATVTTGATYGLYQLAKHYIIPLISPPPPPQLEADKAAIDASFAEAFAKLDTLSATTTALKEAEEERSKRVNSAMDEVESAITALKESAKKREEENRRLAEEIKGLRTLIPKSLEGQKESQAQALQELQNELKSLKSLVVNRTGAATARPAYIGGQQSSPAAPTAATPSADGGNVLGSAGASSNGMPRPNPVLPFGGAPGGKPTIPAWQLAAASKSTGGDQGGSASSS